MIGPISFGNDRSIGRGATGTQLDIHAGKVDIRMIPENAVGNDISKCINIRDTGTGALYPIATATPPQEFDLPLVEGFVHYEPGTKSTYSKSQEGLVVVHFYCKKADGTDIVQNDTIAMLPEGFHPSANVHIPANVSFNGGSVYSQDVATAVADPTGRVWIAFPPAGCKAVTTTLVFYAAS